jgi:acyl-coenzyme A synthetase/AMP-(fatty) acid ligase
MISSYEYLGFHAAERPADIALIVDGRAIPYGEFKRDVATLSRALREFDLSRGSLVTVGCEDLYGHWLLLLAFERLGIVTASLSSGEGADCRPLLASSDLVLSEPGFPIEGAKCHQPLSHQWLSHALTGKEDTQTDTDHPENPEAPLRIARTSGTTGVSKRLLFTRRIHDLRGQQLDLVQRADATLALPSDHAAQDRGRLHPCHRRDPGGRHPRIGEPDGHE